MALFVLLKMSLTTVQCTCGRQRSGIRRRDKPHCAWYIIDFRLAARWQAHLLEHAEEHRCWHFSPFRVDVMHRIVFLWLILSISSASLAAAAATDCGTVLGAICQLNGAGKHCHPCSPQSYVICSDEGKVTVEECPTGKCRIKG